MDPEINVKLPGVDMEGQEPPPQCFEIDDPDIPQDPSTIVPEFPADPDGPTQVSTPTTEGQHRYTRVRSQPDIYTPSIIGKRYKDTMTELERQGLIHPDAHIFVQEDFTKPNPT